MEPIIIGIVTHNSNDIFQTLDHFATFLPNPRYQLVIYDNASEKEYVEKMKGYQFVHVIEGKENLGFGHGHNQIFLHQKTAVGVICNPDILVEEQTIEQLIFLLQQDQTLAGVSPKVLNEDQTVQHLVRHKLTVFDYMLRFIPFGFVKNAFKKRLADYECRFLSDTQYSFIRMGSGCFMVIDIAKFQAINGFDERFFMYFEDNDLCLRFEQKGYRLLYTPFDSVIHLYGKEAHRNPKLFLIFLQSMGKFFHKWGWRFF
ncbi:glycosyltransferase family 2 protein [Enterococcus bulliens]